VKARRRDDDRLPPHLADWPSERTDPHFAEWWKERCAWGLAHGEGKLQLLQERRRRHLAEMEPIWAAYRSEQGIPDEKDGAA